MPPRHCKEDENLTGSSPSPSLPLSLSLSLISSFFSLVFFSYNLFVADVGEDAAYGGEAGGGDGTSDEHCSASVRCGCAILPVLANEDTNQQRSSEPFSVSAFLRFFLSSLFPSVSKVLSYRMR
jgi:hypothetical protein